MVLDLSLLPNKKDTANLRYTVKRDTLFLGQSVHFVLIERCSKQQKYHPKLSICQTTNTGQIHLATTVPSPSTHPLMMLAMVTFWQPPHQTSIQDSADRIFGWHRICFLLESIESSCVYGISNGTTGKAFLRKWLADHTGVGWRSKKPNRVTRRMWRTANAIKAVKNVYVIMRIYICIYPCEMNAI